MSICEEFLAGYSELRDGVLPLPTRVRLQQHLHECESCARYDRVVRRGVDMIQDADPLQPSDDFLFRLQHRILHVEDEMRGPGRLGSGATPAVVGMVAALLGIGAWLPALHQAPEPHRLPSVAALAPETPLGRAPDLFGPVPPLRPAAELNPVFTSAELSGNSLLFRHSPLGRTVADAAPVRLTAAP